MDAVYPKLIAFRLQPSCAFNPFMPMATKETSSQNYFQKYNRSRQLVSKNIYELELVKSFHQKVEFGYIILMEIKNKITK